jgi:cell fate (sporulation/competence/biofilm development) regulator YlbF (YheA/YmcA/DUF963 family)
MNVYDLAHDLARAIKESGEFMDFDRMRKEAEADSDVKAMIDELRQLQLEIQTAQVTGSQPKPDAITRMQTLSTMLATKPLAVRYMQAEAAFSVMMSDVFKILGEAVEM